MPIPRKNKDEFFISDLNPILIDSNDNQAIIDVPHEFGSSTFFSESSIIFRRDITLENRIFRRDITLEDRIFHNFRSEMMSIFSNSNNNRSDIFDNIATVFSRIIFTECLDHFLVTTTNNGIISLTYDFYLDINNNRRLRDILGTNEFNSLMRSILNYHDNLVKKRIKKDKKRKVKCFYKDFKEFKVHQSYVGKKYIKRIGENHNYSYKNYMNQHKYRKLRYLKRAINL